MTTVDERVQMTIQHLGYDFSRFTLEDFVTYLKQWRQDNRAIFIRGYAFEDEEVDGLWVRADTADYIFYDLRSHPVHQNHIRLHELGHIVLRHRGQPLHDILPPRLLATLGQTFPADAFGGLFRAFESRQKLEELEAEVFAHHVQRYVIQANRLDQLTKHSSSIELLERFTRSLGYHD